MITFVPNDFEIFYVHFGTCITFPRSAWLFGMLLTCLAQNKQTRHSTNSMGSQYTRSAVQYMCKHRGSWTANYLCKNSCPDLNCIQHTVQWKGPGPRNTHSTRPMSFWMHCSIFCSKNPIRKHTVYGKIKQFSVASYFACWLGNNGIIYRQWSNGLCIFFSGICM